MAGLCGGTGEAALQLADRASAERAVWAGVRASSAVQEDGQWGRGTDLRLRVSFVSQASVAAAA